MKINLKKQIAVIVTVLTLLSLLIPIAPPVSAAATIPPEPNPLPGGTLDPLAIPKFADPLPVLGVMPKTLNTPTLDYYEIAARQFKQQVLPTGLPKTTVWGYGSAADPSTFNYPALTIDATVNKPVRVKWINQLVDSIGKYLPPLLPVDQTLHWANPPGGETLRDTRLDNPPQTAYMGPVPLVTHLHGAHVSEESDGYPLAWTLPAAINNPGNFAKVGSKYDEYKADFKSLYNVTWEPGSSVYQYPNDQRATTLWFHDHVIGMTRTNVYAGLAGFYLLRGGTSDLATGLPKEANEIPLLIQDRSFNEDGSLFYPGDRAFFEGLEKSQLQIPFTPSPTIDDGPSDIAPIWNPEFFGNTMVVNGKTWPYQTVEKERYRFRLLNGSDSRTMILKLDNDMPFWVIGADGGFLPKPAQVTQLLMGPAERADVIIDFSGVTANTVTLQNIGPDSPFGGGVSGVDFPASNSATTGQVLQFRVVPASGGDSSIAPAKLKLPARTSLKKADATIKVSLNELESENVFVAVDGDGAYILDDDGNVIAISSSSILPSGQFVAAFAPAEAALGTLDADGQGVPKEFMDDITEMPKLNQTTIWEIHNFTEDAHPIHLHLVEFEVVGRIDANGVQRGPEAWETGTKDTAIAYPGEVTLLKAKFDKLGLYLWHCHILSHEDNEMMRPYQVVP